MTLHHIQIRQCALNVVNKAMIPGNQNAARIHKEQITGEMVKAYERGLTMRAIGELCGYHHDTIRYRLVQSGVKMRPQFNRKSK